MNQYNIWNQQQQHHHQDHHPQGDLAGDEPLSPDALIARLNGLSTSQNYAQFISALDSPAVSQSYEYPERYTAENFPFHLPLELQGGVSSINSRRPSFAAEQSYTHPHDQQQQQQLFHQHQQQLQPPQQQHLHQQTNHFSLEMFAHHNNLQQNFRSRRPSIQINSSYTTDPQQQQQQQHSQGQGHQQNHHYKNNNNSNSLFSPSSSSSSSSAYQGGAPLRPTTSNNSGVLELDNGLLLQGNVIVTSSQLQQAYFKTRGYFCATSAEELYEYLTQSCLNDPYLQKVVFNLKKLNNMFSLIKPLVLVLTKSGKYEILSTPINSNILLCKNDVVIVDGDRGKDLVYILDPSISLDVAILINYLKKRQHSKSISYGHGSFNQQMNNNGQVMSTMNISNTVQDLVKGQGILDEETQFQMPSKQVLRFATFQEIGNLQFKLVEEIKSLKTSLLKISNQPTLSGNLTILNSEYQFDQKKLTFFYYSNQRLDFRNLIKELFKIYKTRIWLCAVPKPTGPMTVELNNEVGFEDCKNDDFHVRNFKGTLMELINTNIRL